MFLKSLISNRLAHAYRPSNEGQDREVLQNLRPAWATQMESASKKKKKQRRNISQIITTWFSREWVGGENSKGTRSMLLEKTKTKNQNPTNTIL